MTAGREVHVIQAIRVFDWAAEDDDWIEAEKVPHCVEMYWNYAPPPKGGTGIVFISVW